MFKNKAYSIFKSDRMRACCLQIKTHNLNLKLKKSVLRDLQYFQSGIKNVEGLPNKYRVWFSNTELFTLQKSLLNFGEYSFNHKTRKHSAVF